MCLFPSIAFAAEPSAVYEISNHLLEIVLSALGLGAMYLVRLAIKTAEKKTKFDIPIQFEKLMEMWADKGIDFAQEKAHQALKDNKGKLKGGEKLELAAGFALTDSCH